jgi:uncharacterized membrane protein YukC
MELVFFFENFGNHDLNFSKKLVDKNQHVAIYVSHKCVKFQFQRHYTLGCTKMTILQIYYSEQYIFSNSPNLSELVIFV